MTNLATYLFQTGQVQALESMCTMITERRPKDAPQGLDGVERRRQQKRDYMRRVRARAKAIGIRADEPRFCWRVRAAVNAAGRVIEKVQ